MYYYTKIRQLKTSILIAVALWLCLSSLPALHSSESAPDANLHRATPLAAQL